MALIFTDQQVKDLTQSVLDAPTLIQQANDQAAAAVANKAKKLDQDNQNAVYSTNWINIIAQYHAEMKYLNGVQRTDYNAANIGPAGMLTDPNIHFITSPIWTKFQPMVDASNNGNPTSAWTNTEDEALNRATPAIALLKNGWTDGAASTTTTGAYVPLTGFPLTSASGISVGNRVLLEKGSDYLYGTVDTLVGLDMKVTVISMSSTESAMSSGTTVKNFFAGFNLAQRDSGVGLTNPQTAFMVYLKTPIDTAIADWKTRLQAELAALNLNDAVGTEATQITAAKAQVNSHISIITTWQAFPSIGVGTSRFGTNLPALEADIAARPAQYAARISEITTALGSVGQAGDGTYTGTGNYFNLFDNLNLRLNKAGGTLRTFYDSDLGVQLFTQMAVNIQNQADRDSETFNIKTFTQNGNGTNTVVVSSVTGLAVSDSIKVMSKTQAVLSGTISAISGLNVTVNFSVSADYKFAESARLVKQA